MAKPCTLGKIRLARVPVGVPPVDGEPSNETWSGGLWGRFLPDRRRASGRQPGIDRRRSDGPTGVFASDRDASG